MYENIRGTVSESTSGTHCEGFKLGLMGDRGDSEPSHDKVHDGLTRLEGQGASRGHKGPFASRGTANTAACMKSYDDETVATGTVAAEAVEVSWENQGKHLKGIKELTFKELTKPAAQLKYLYTNASSLGHKHRS